MITVSGVNVTVCKPLTVPEFLAWEERQELPYEFDGWQPVAMTGGTIAHDLITFNIRKALDVGLAGGRCQTFGPDVKIAAGDTVRYPDAVVACTPQRNTSIIVEAPVVVFEVLSVDMSRTDRIDKVRDYLKAATIHRYAILEQDGVAAAVFERKADGWRVVTLTADGVLSMPEIDISLLLAECYIGVEVAASGG